MVLGKADGISVGNATNYNAASTASYTTTVGKILAITTNSDGLTITGATVLKDVDTTDSGIVTYHSHMYIVKATATTIKMTTTNTTYGIAVIPLN